MVEFTFADHELGQKIQDPTKYYPSEVSQELAPLLDVLSQAGQIPQADLCDGTIRRLSAQFFYLFYQRVGLEGAASGLDNPDHAVLLLDLKVKPADILRQRFAIADHPLDHDTSLSIPQYDNPKKIIAALELIHQGISESYQLGYELGHRGKKREYIMRHGNYAKHTLEQLKLITKVRKEKVWLAELTDKGRVIAEAPIRSLKYRALIEAMLNYPSVWQVIVAITAMEAELNADTILTDELIKTLAFTDVATTADTANTSNRRAQTIKNWIKWIVEYSGIPLRIHDDGNHVTDDLLHEDTDSDLDDLLLEQPAE